MKQKIIGLTGSIASGKDTVAKILKKSGAIIIDADQLGHKTYPLVLADLVKAFGIGIVNNKGQVDRKKLGKIVFGDKKKLKQLNLIMHSLMMAEIKSKILNQKSKQGKIIINAALPRLFKGMVDEVWVVKASKKDRLKRLVKHGLSREDALKRINSQANGKEYIKMADKIIINNSSKKDLNAKVQALLKL